MKTEDIAISITGYSYSNIKETIPDGVDKEEIAAVYEEIIDEYLQKGIPREIPALINVSGVPGAGKSTFCKKLLAMPENSSAIYIGFDAIMENERLPYIREEVNHAEEAFKRWELSARIAGYELLKRAIENKYLIIFDHSSALPQHIDLFNLLLSEGYEVHFNFIFIPEEEAREASEKQETLYTSILY
ncbi:zeta toxin family protein [Bacteroides fragilis]|nr:zeta toxin family protein [Bacteroides fragilis]